MPNDKKEVLEGEVLTSNNTSKGLLVGAGLLAVGASNAFAIITVDTASTVTDLGTAFAAILLIAVTVFGFRKIAGMF